MKKTISKIPDSELTIMKAIWNGHPEMSRHEIEEILESEKHLAPTTINTLLTRLENKQFIKSVKKGKTNYYTAVISKKDYQMRESREIIDQLFDGSLSDFVNSLYGGSKIPEEKISELNSFLESLNYDDE